jgi:hypothetical protein
MGLNIHEIASMATVFALMHVVTAYLGANFIVPGGKTDANE